MRHELGISPAIIVFENLSDMLSTLEEYAEFHNRAIERYRDRLGLLLRQREMKADGQVLQGNPQGLDPSAFKEMGIEQATGGSVEGGVLLSNRKRKLRKRKEKEKIRVGWFLKPKIIRSRSQELLTEIPLLLMKYPFCSKLLKH